MAGGTLTMAQAKQQHAEAIENNRDLGIVQYRSKERLSDQVYEVAEGKHHLPGGITLGPGMRFHPTERQVRTNSLRGKARELSRSEERDLKRTGRMFAGADFEAMQRQADEQAAAEAAQRRAAEDAQAEADRVAALELLPMAEGTRKLVLDSTLTAEDFDGVEPVGPDKQYTRRQVEELIAVKKV